MKEISILLTEDQYEALMYAKRLSEDAAYSAPLNSRRLELAEGAVCVFEEIEMVAVDRP